MNLEIEKVKPEEELNTQLRKLSIKCWLNKYDI